MSGPDSTTVDAMGPVMTGRTKVSGGTAMLPKAVEMVAWTLKARVSPLRSLA